MTDIVERLRAADISGHGAYSALVREARAEIERLRNGQENWKAEALRIAGVANKHLAEIERLRAQKSKMICEGCRRLAEVADENEQLKDRIDKHHRMFEPLRAEIERLTFELKAAQEEIKIADGEIERLKATLGIWQRQFYELKAQPQHYRNGAEPDMVFRHNMLVLLTGGLSMENEMAAYLRKHVELDATARRHGCWHLLDHGLVLLIFRRAAEEIERLEAVLLRDKP